VLVTGGGTGSSTVTPTSEIYDPTSNSWSTTGSLVTARAHHAAVLLTNGKVLAVGGYAGGATSSVELYDPTAGTSGTWSVAASTNVARYLNGTSLLPDGKVLVSGGVITKYPLNTAELYDPGANTWTFTGNLTAPLGRYAHTSTLLPDGTVLLAGGEGATISCGKACTGIIQVATAETYNEAAGKFTAAASLPRALAYHVTTLTSTGHALTGGGSGYNATCCVVVSNAEYYTPLTCRFLL
jgi:WD40 repeat protein